LPRTTRSNAAWPRNNLGLLRLQCGAWQEAATQFEAAIARNDGVALFHHNLGAAYERCGRAADAAAQYARTLELQPEHAMAQIGLARVKGAPATAQVATADRPDSTVNAIQPQPLPQNRAGNRSGSDPKWVGAAGVHYQRW
jgi:tetratricopeptide (TPR) repeat protein